MRYWILNKLKNVLISCVLTSQHLQKSKNDFHSRRSELVEDASVTAIAEDPLENLGKCHMTWSQLPFSLDCECDLWYLQVRRRYSGTRSARSWPPWVSSSPPCSPVTRSGGAFRGRGSKTPGSEHFPAFDFVSRFRYFDKWSTSETEVYLYQDTPASSVSPFQPESLWGLHILPCTKWPRSQYCNSDCW